MKNTVLTTRVHSGTALRRGRGQVPSGALVGYPAGRPGVVSSCGGVRDAVWSAGVDSRVR